MIKHILFGAVFYSILAALLHYAQVSDGYSVAIIALFGVMDLASYAMGLKKGYEITMKGLG